MNIPSVSSTAASLRLLHTIPPPPHDFTGREAELETLRQTSGRGSALITGLKGMGGIGKTALALVLAREWAPRFPDAALLLDGNGLAGDSAHSAAQLMEQVIHAFHPEAKNLPEDPEALRGIYHGVLNGKKVLLLLDNAKDAAQARPLLPPEGCTLIVTSRSGFALDGVASYALGRMDGAEAEALLRAAYGKLTSDEMKQLLHLCAGLPLALKLAAAHLVLDAADHDGTANVTSYIGKLGSGPLARLDAEADNAGETTITETLRLSVEPLGREDRCAWEKLGIFASPFDVEAAEWIAGADEEMLERFLRRSLLESAGEDRYRLHDLAVDYARIRLSIAEIAALSLVHAKYYQAVAYAADQLYMEGEVLAGLALFDRERAQIEAAFAAMDARQDETAAEQVIEIVDAIAEVGDLRFHSRQKIDWLQSQLRAARRTGDREAEGNALGNIGSAHMALGDARKAIGYYAQWLDIAREIGDRRGEGEALGNLGSAHAAVGDTRKAIGYYGQLLESARGIGDRRGEGIALGNIGIAHKDLGDPPKAIVYFEDQLKITREIGHRRGEGNALGNIGSAHMALGDARKAIGYFEDQLKITREIGDRRGEGNALGSLGSAHKDLGDARKAIGYFEDQLKITREIEDRRGERNALGGLGGAHADLGYARKAIEYYEKQLKIVREIGDRSGEGNALGGLGLAHDDLGDTRMAIGYYEQCLEIDRELGDLDNEATDLLRSSVAHDSLGERAEAVRSAEAALAIYKAIKDSKASMVQDLLDHWEK